jgi:hypothetical protein
MGSHKNTLLQKLALLGLVTSVGIGTGTHVIGQVAGPGGAASYQAAVEEARTLAEMIAVNPQSPAARQALLRLQVVLATLPPTVRAEVIADLVTTGALPTSVMTTLAEALQDVPLASTTQAPDYF